MEQRRRRSQLEEGLQETTSEQQSQQVASPKQEQLDSDKPILKKGQHAEPLPSGGYMIITTGFDY